MKFIGVDWAKGGWLAVVMDKSDGYAEKFHNIKSLWNEYKDAELILIDIPIGLPSKELRLCDIEAKNSIKQRRNSVFHVPCREAVYDIKNASKINRRCMNRGVSPPAIGIIPSIKQVDIFLRNNPEALEVIKRNPS